MLADQFVEGAKAAGNDVEKISLIGKIIQFCKGCLGCQKLGRCVINDDVNDIMAKVLKADGEHRLRNVDDAAYLFPYKFGGGNAKMLLKLAREVLGIFEAEEVRGLADGFAIMQVSGGSLHHEIADDESCSLTCSLTHKVAEVVGRKEQLLSAITDGGQAKLALTSFIIIVFE